MTVGEFCNRQVVIARRDDRLADAARRVRDLHVGALVVVDEDRGRCTPVGILTDRDMVIRALTDDAADVARLHVGDLMTTKIVTARESEDLTDALKRMRSFGIRRLPVVNDSGGLEGILSFDDLVDLVADELSELTRLLAREQTREREGHL
jgi:CBS domain-containing protein